MSSFVVSDNTILAIVEGMRKYGLIAKRKRQGKDMAEALRFMNEYMSTRRYNGHTALDDYALACNHQEVTAMPRDYADGEILAACRCWLYQVDVERLVDFDFITLHEAVELLVKKVVASCKEKGTLKVKCYFGDYHYFFFDEAADDYVDVYDLYGWDLQDKAA